MDAIVARANARFRSLGLDEGDALSTMTGAVLALPSHAGDGRLR